MFVVCIALQSGFVAVYTITRIKCHKAYIKSLLKRDLKSGKFDAELVVFSEEQLRNAEWEHSREFFLGEDKFDVVRIVDSDGIKLYHCINDKREKELFKSLDTHKKQKNLLEDVIKKFCLNIPSLPSFYLRTINTPVLHRDYFSDQYTYSFSDLHFRPPTCLI